MGTRLGPDKRGRRSSVEDDPVVCLVFFVTTKLCCWKGVGFVPVTYMHALFNRNGCPSNPIVSLDVFGGACRM